MQPLHMKAYLDNNVVSAIARDDHASESAAIDRLIEAYEDGRIELVTSELALDEINEYQGIQRPPVQWVFRLLRKVPIVRWEDLVAMTPPSSRRPLIISSIFRNDPMYDSLLTLGLQPVDARHLFVAARQSCSAFLTCDGGILDRGGKIHVLAGIRCQRPSEFVSAQAL